MLNEITKITFKGIKEAANAGENITIIVNGQYYDLEADNTAAEMEILKQLNEKQNTENHFVNISRDDLKRAAGNEINEDFINGVKFAAAALEDRRARQFMVWQGINQNRKTTTKKALEYEWKLNAETKSIIDFLLYIIKEEAGIDKWFADYNNGALWHL